MKTMHKGFWTFIAIAFLILAIRDGYSAIFENSLALFPTLAFTVLFILIILLWKSLTK